MSPGLICLFLDRLWLPFSGVGMDSAASRFKASDIRKVSDVRLTYVYCTAVLLTYDVYEELFVENVIEFNGLIIQSSRVDDGSLPAWFTQDFDYRELQEVITWKSIVENLLRLITLKFGDYSLYSSHIDFCRLFYFDQTLDLPGPKIPILELNILSSQKTLFRKSLAQMMYGLLMMRDDDYEGAIKFFDDAIKNYPDCSAFHY